MKEAVTESNSPAGGGVNKRQSQQTLTKRASGNIKLFLCFKVWKSLVYKTMNHYKSVNCYEL